MFPHYLLEGSVSIGTDFFKILRINCSSSSTYKFSLNIKIKRNYRETIAFVSLTTKTATTMPAFLSVRIVSLHLCYR